jgi:hypothetical protein
MIDSVKQRGNDQAGNKESERFFKVKIEGSPEDAALWRGFGGKAPIVYSFLRQK